MSYTVALDIVNTNAVAMLLNGLYVKLSNFHQDWKFFSNSVAFSQITFQISRGNMPCSPSLTIAAVIDCIHN